MGEFTVNSQNPTKWTLDKSHTFVNFSINRLFSAVTGELSTFDGNFNFDAANLKGSKADYTIAVNSVNTDENKRDKHL